MSTSLWSPEPIDLEKAGSLEDYGDVYSARWSWVAFDMGFESTRSTQRRRLVAPVRTPLGHLSLPRFGGRPSSATLGDAAIAEC